MKMGLCSYAQGFSRTRAFLPVVVAALFLTASLNPAAAGPGMKVTGAVMAKDVEKYQASSIPREEADTFHSNDAQAVMWLKIGDISGVHNLRWEWYDPNGKLYYKTPNHKINADGKRRDQHTSWHKIAIKDEPAASLPGQWQVKVFLDNSPVATTSFQIKKQFSLNDIADMPRVKPDRSKWALIIGIERYRKAAPVQFAEKDARTMRDYFTNFLGVPEENTITLVNEMATKAELDVMVKDRLRGLLREQDTLYVYYAGHGIPADETPYLLPYDGDPDSPRYTAYPVETLYADLDKLPAKNIFVFMDTCFSGRSVKYRREARERTRALDFMRNTVDWFEKGYHKLGEGDEAERRRMFFIWNNEYLKGAQEPLEAIKKYLAANEKETKTAIFFFDPFRCQGVHEPVFLNGKRSAGGYANSVIPAKAGIQSMI